MLPVAGIAHTEPGEDVYAPLDIDVSSPALTPGASTPEPGGLDYLCELSDLLSAVVRRGNLVGMDVIEVSPLCDVAAQAARPTIDAVGDRLVARSRDDGARRVRGGMPCLQHT